MTRDEASQSAFYTSLANRNVGLSYAVLRHCGD